MEEQQHGVQNQRGLEKKDLPMAVAKRVEIIESACENMLVQDKRTTRFNEFAETINECLAKEPAADARPISGKTLERLWYRWKNHGKDWKMLLDGRTWWFEGRSVPLTHHPGFRDYLTQLSGRHQKWTDAVKELYAAWRNGCTIPGYEGLNPEKDMPLPKGWSVDNLQRKRRKQKVEDLQKALDEVERIVEEIRERRRSRTF